MINRIFFLRGICAGGDRPILQNGRPRKKSKKWILEKGWPQAEESGMMRDKECGGEARHFEKAEASVGEL